MKQHLGELQKILEKPPRKKGTGNGHETLPYEEPGLETPQRVTSTPTDWKKFKSHQPHRIATLLAEGQRPCSPGEVPSRLQQRFPAGGDKSWPPWKPKVRLWQRQHSPLSK